MKKRIRIITKVPTSGPVFSDVYCGWFKGERLSDDQFAQQLTDDQRIEINGVIYGQEGRMRNLYRNSPPVFKDISRTCYLKI